MVWIKKKKKKRKRPKRFFFLFQNQWDTWILLQPVEQHLWFIWIKRQEEPHLKINRVNTEDIDENSETVIAWAVPQDKYIMIYGSGPPLPNSKLYRLFCINSQKAQTWERKKQYFFGVIFQISYPSYPHNSQPAKQIKARYMSSHFPIGQ